VLVIGLSCILIQEKLYPEIENRFLEIFDIIISVLKFVRQLEQVEATIDKNDSADEGNEHTKKIKQELLMTFIDAKKNFITRLGEQEEEKVDLSDDEPELEDEDEEDEEEINESPFIPGKVLTLIEFLY